MLPRSLRARLLAAFLVVAAAALGTVGVAVLLVGPGYFAEAMGHLPGDPVQPGCLCVDAVWQLLGFYCLWRGALGTGRALGCGEVFFSGQIRPYNKVVRYEIDVKRFQHLKDSGASIVIADANIFVDNELIMTLKDARTGVFHGIAYPDYPHKSKNAVGGVMVRE